MKALLLALFAIALIAPAEAAQRGGNNARAKQLQKLKIQKEKERKERERKRTAIQDALNKMDANKDGSLSREEYLSNKADPNAAARDFDRYNKNGDRFLSKSELAESLGL